jgi:hypothetical protein
VRILIIVVIVILLLMLLGCLDQWLTAGVSRPSIRPPSQSSFPRPEPLPLKTGAKQIVFCLAFFLLGVATDLRRSSQGNMLVSRSGSEPGVLMINHLRQLAELTTLAVDLTDIQQTSINGHVGGISAVLLVKGEALITTDLGRARFESIDSANKKAVLILAPPTVSTAEIDHDHSRLFAVTEQGLWLITPGNRLNEEVVNRAFANAQHAIADAGNQPELLAKARHQTEIVLQGFFGALGWEVNIRWSDENSKQTERQ